MSVEFILNKAVESLSRGRLGVVLNPDFSEEWKKVEAEDRNLMTKFYDIGTLIIIDDEKHRLVTKFSLVRKR
jgi:hypothetical protein